jgi:hypothetical protein
MATLLQYTNEDQPNEVVLVLDDQGNLAIGGSLTNNTNATPQSAAAGVAGSSFPSVQTATQEFSLTATNLKALRATPMQLVAAPGAGKYVRVLSYDLIYTFLTSAFTNTNATMKLFQGTTANAVALTADLGAILTNTASRQENGTAPIDVVDTIAHMQNVGLFLGNDGSAEFLVGLGSLKVLVTYQIVTP